MPTRNVVTAVAFCASAAIVLVGRAGDAGPREDTARQRVEVTRLRAHFDTVLAELQARDVTGLQPTQRRARAELLRALARYRDRGVFPHNHDFAGMAVPYFRDEHGTLCAMAYLLAIMGRGDIVHDVAARRNNAHIPELATDPRLAAWLDSVGLAVTEAARIQPEYGGDPIVVDDRSARRYVLPSFAVATAALASAAVNWAARRETKGGRALLIGALSGAVSTFLGVAILSTDDADIHALGAFDITVGVAAIGAAVQRGLRGDRPAASRPPVASSESRLSVHVLPAGQRRGIAPAPVVELRF